MKIRFQGRPKPDHKNCYCNDYPVYNFHWLPTETLWAFNTRQYTWLWWSLLITGINKK